MNDLKIPVGISDFAKIRNYDYYYVDKTGLIADLLEKETAEVTLITRPRRFGKTMGMSMLANFFDIRKDSKAMFEGLEIAKNTALCSEWMNQWPTLFLSFKKVDGLNFQDAYDMLTVVLANLYKKHMYLLESDKINPFDKEIITHIMSGDASVKEIKDSLALLTTTMQEYYGKPVILLIDEYDVPIAKASAKGYYAEMLDVVKGLMQALKDNDALRFAVVTGCLRIAKESIFTGTNNFVSDTISSSHLNEYFGFTQEDVNQILEDADYQEHAADMKNWYDGYHFGDLDVYCPWDVMNYLRDLQRNPKAKPASYWKNTSDNSIIRSFIDYRGAKISQKLETLLSGGYILQKIEEDLTYDYLHSSEENLWSILYLTGYLTQVREDDLPAPLPEDTSALIIPNAEVREIFKTTIQKWFDESAQTWNLTTLFDAMWSGDAETLTAEINKLLYKTISYHDYKEDFYHAFLTGILAGSGCAVESNREHGEGRSDIVMYHPDRPQVVLFKAKYAKRLGGLQKSCAEALQQIEDRQYAKEFEEDYDSVLCYGIAFYKKRCLVQNTALEI
ncbi:MAG: AAA family ATPase [Firmicutes bacterium]|nr:AAA family ATPase [Bacillota bacterium]